MVFVRFVALVIVLGLLSLPSLAQINAFPGLAKKLGNQRVMQGPMVGAVGRDTARIWVRVSAPVGVQIEYSTDPHLKEPRQSRVVEATIENDQVAVIDLAGLQPRTRYYYRVRVGGRGERYMSALAPASFVTAPAGPSRFKVAFGSCARFGKDRQQPIWRAVQAASPDLFLWLGDNIYGDTMDPRMLAEEYQRQRDVDSLQALLRCVPQLAIWDDHDFGLNDGGRWHPGKVDSLAVFRRYWANPSTGLPDTPGIFFRYSYGGVDFFFLDVRYHRDLNEMPDDERKTMLGAGQFAWLQRELRHSQAVFKVLVSGSGWSNAKGPGGDAWSSYLTERNRLFDFIRDAKITGVVLLSGDTHVAELNCIPWSARGGYDLYDMVSSPLAQHCTDSWLRRRPELRIRPVYFGSPSFGLIEFVTDTDDPWLAYTAQAANGETVMRRLVLRAGELHNGVQSWPDKVDPHVQRQAEQAQHGRGYYMRASELGLPAQGLCAHRGAMHSHPENTLAAFREALRLGAAMIEFDVRLTKDGETVVIHDPTVDRTTNGSGLVAEMALAEIRKLDAGSWKALDFAGERVPLLAEVLAAMPDHVWLNVHVKGGVAAGRKVVQELASGRRLHQALLACNADAARAARDEHPSVRICNMDGRDDPERYVAESRRMRAAFVQFRAPLPDNIGKLCAALRRDGIRINVYGVTDPRRVAKLLRLGVDFVLVDDLGAMTEPSTPRSSR